MALLLLVAAAVGVAVFAARRAEAAPAPDQVSVAGAAPTATASAAEPEDPNRAATAIVSAVTGYALQEAGAEVPEIGGAAVLAGLATGDVLSTVAVVVGAAVSIFGQETPDEPKDAPVPPVKSESESPSLREYFEEHVFF